jgi:hypothetical protein
MIASFPTYFYGWLPLWLQKKIPEKNAVGHQGLLGYHVPYTWASDLVLKFPK